MMNRISTGFVRSLPGGRWARPRGGGCQWVPASPVFSELLAPVGKEIQTLFLIFSMTPPC